MDVSECGELKAKGLYVISKKKWKYRKAIDRK
jgi:hypothetical protein